MKSKWAVNWLAVLIFASLAWTGCGQEPTAPPAAPADVAVRPGKSLGHRALFYLPNRLLDVIDIFRCRLRLGPGLAADANITIYAANFIGSYRSVYVGLPGPRMAPILPPVAGREKWKGLMVMGVDATDDSPYPPAYTASECNIGAHLLIVGADLGFDPVEMGDFLAGFIMKDVRGDDL